MNNDQIKELLLRIDPEADDFSVTLSGKASKKVNGLYYPDRREIILHSGNFETENEMIYTAIHEFAHHVHCTCSPVPVSGNAHSVKFWDIFHRMLYAAEELGIYDNPFCKDPAFIKLTEKIRSHYLFNSGALMKDFGSMLMEAMRLCQAHHVSFEDYADRALGFHRNAAKAVIKTAQMDVDPEVGPENMKLLSRIKDGQQRENIAEDLKHGKSPDMVRADLSAKLQREKTMSEMDILKEEKERLERVIERTREKLDVIDKKMVIMKARQPRKTETMFDEESDEIQ